MKIEQIVDYVFHTPMNTNKAILIEMLEDLILAHGGTLDGADQPDTGSKDIIYDGGIET